MGRGLDTYYYHPKPSVIIFQVKVIQDHKNGKTKKVGFGKFDACIYASFSPRKRAITLVHFLSAILGQFLTPARRWVLQPSSLAGGGGISPPL